MLNYEFMLKITEYAFRFFMFCLGVVIGAILERKKNKNKKY